MNINQKRGKKKGKGGLNEIVNTVGIQERSLPFRGSGKASWRRWWIPFLGVVTNWVT